jgi:hypothetical protein
VGELVVDVGRRAAREWIRAAGCRIEVAAHSRTRPKGQRMAAQGCRHGDGAGLERKIRAAGRPWTIGDIAMVADGQWAVDLTTAQDDPADTAVEQRAADGRSVQMTVEELARAVGARFGDTHHDEERG